MHPLDVLRPLPALIGDEETEPAHPLRFTGAHGKLDCFVVDVDVRVRSRHACQFLGQDRPGPAPHAAVVMNIVPRM